MKGKSWTRKLSGKNTVRKAGTKVVGRRGTKNFWSMLNKGERREENQFPGEGKGNCWARTGHRLKLTALQKFSWGTEGKALTRKAFQ